MEDKYIKLLRKLKARLDNNQHINDTEFGELLDQLEIDRGLYKSLKISLFDPDRQRPRVGNETSYLITMDAYMKLLEYDELKEARADSKRARKEAQIATWIAIFAIVINIVMASIPNKSVFTHNHIHHLENVPFDTSKIGKQTILLDSNYSMLIKQWKNTDSLDVKFKTE